MTDEVQPPITQNVDGVHSNPNENKRSSFQALFANIFGLKSQSLEKSSEFNVSNFFIEFVFLYVPKLTD